MQRTNQDLLWEGDAVVALATEGIDVLGDLNATDHMKQHYARVLLSRLLAARGLT